jgi:RNA polymerase sigma-70 factor, ECF subfamily
VTDRQGWRQIEAMDGAPVATFVTASHTKTPDLAELFEREFDYVWFTLRRFGVPERDLEDVAHDVFLHVHRHLAEFDPTRPVRPWLCSFVYRAASDYRKLARHRVERLDGPFDATDPSPSPADRVAARQTLELAWTALEELDVDRRAVFVLHDVEGLPIPEVAEILGVPLNTAYSRLRLARDQFAKVLQRVRARRGDM